MDTKSNDQHFDRIESCFGKYETLQLAHYEALKVEDMPDIALMTRQRQEAFHSLEESLDLFMATAGSTLGKESVPLLSRFEGRLNKLMALDDKITNEIQRHKAQLKNNLNRVRKGQVAMKGYGTAGITPQKTHVLSMNR